jgi:hypothetical protein
MAQFDPDLRARFGHVTIALLIAPLSPSVAISVLLTLWTVLTARSIGDIIGCAIYSLAFGLFFSVIIGYPVALLFGLPIHRILIEYGHRRCSAYAMIYAMLGMIGWLLILFISYETHYHLLPGMFGRRASAFELGAPCGAVAGITFWLIARPDRIPQIESLQSYYGKAVRLQTREHSN